jgi:phosphoglycerol transferase MdoB-like AlkP superfamily enzyme
MNSRLKVLLANLGLLLALYTISRLLFLALNIHSYNQLPLHELVEAFVVGARFDIAAICRVNAPFIVLSLLPFGFVDKSWYRGFLKAVFLIANLPFLLLNVVDYEYLKFTGQRSSLSLLDMAGDIPDQISQLAFHYWYLAAIAAGLFFALFYCSQKWHSAPRTKSTSHWAYEVLILVLAVSLAVIGGRGGLQRRRLTTALAEVADKESLSQLALNSTYTMINSQHKCDGMTPLHYFANEADMTKQFPPSNLPARKLTGAPKNIVIIIVESLSAEYTGIGNPGHGYTPFLDSLAEKGIYFKNGFADGRRSIDAPPSILAGLPHLRDETFFCTQFKTLHGIGSILKSQGYNTSFFHGGRNGTMSFDTFSRRMGFDDYYGLNEYPKPQDSDGIWGIYDEPYLQYFAEQLSHRPQPFASVVFTLSTHNPYKVPPQYEHSLPKGELPIHRTVGYFDHALQHFFATAESLPWYKNTLFVITGDHIGPPQTISPRMLDSYRVPIVFYFPGGDLPAVNRDRIVQHVDIGPSLLDFTGMPTEQTLPFGHSIFDSAYPGLAIGQKDGNFWIADAQYYLEYRQNAPSKLFARAKLDTPLTEKADVRARLESALKAHIQWFTNGLIEDRLYH